MFETIRNAWKIEDLRKKLIFTMLILVVVRIGSAIPVPFLDPTMLKLLVASGGSLLGYLDILTGGAFSNATLFALSISPYITASIVIQLLTVAIPALERMAKEGEEGQKKMKKINRYTTVGLALLQSIAYYTMFRNQYGAVAYTLSLIHISGKKPLILTAEVDGKLVRSAGNIPGVSTAIVGAVSTYDILNAGKLVVSAAAVDKLEEVYAK